MVNKGLKQEYNSVGATDRGVHWFSDSVEEVGSKG